MTIRFNSNTISADISKDYVGKKLFWFLFVCVTCLCDFRQSMFLCSWGNKQATKTTEMTRKSTLAKTYYCNYYLLRCLAPIHSYLMDGRKNNYSKLIELICAAAVFSYIDLHIKPQFYLIEGKNRNNIVWRGCWYWDRCFLNYCCKTGCYAPTEPTINFINNTNKHCLHSFVHSFIQTQSLFCRGSLLCTFKYYFYFTWLTWPW